MKTDRDRQPTDESAPVPGARKTGPRSRFRSAIFEVDYFIPAVCLLFIACLAALRIPDPLSGDDALYLGGARLINGGAIPYVDFWDAKQPGLFYFDLLAGNLFGFTAVGIQTFEAIYWIVGTLALAIALRSAFEHRYLAVLVPTLILAVYFVFGTPYHTTQLEMLVNLPLLLIIVCLVKAVAKHERQWLLGFAAGLLAGVVVTFKLVLAPIFAAFFVALAIHVHQHQKAGGIIQTLKSLMPLVMVFAAGGIVVVGAVVIDIWWRGGLNAMLWTTFVYPMEWIKTAELAPLSRYVGGVAYWIGLSAAWLPLAGLLLVLPERPRQRIWIAMSVAWFLSGLLVISLQRYSYWTYHFQLLYGPAALLAVLGLDRLLGCLGVRHGFDDAKKIAACAVVILPILMATAPVTLRRTSDVAMIFSQGLDAYRRHAFPKHARLAEVADAVRPLPAGTPIYVVGNPWIYELLGAKPAIAYNGWSFQLTTPAEWRTLEIDLSQAAPLLIFVDNDYAKFIASKSPILVAWLKGNYRAQPAGNSGTWYHRHR